MNVQSNNVRYVRDTRVVEISISLYPTTNDIIVLLGIELENLFFYLSLVRDTCVVIFGEY